MISIGNAVGTKVLEGALRSLSIEGPGRMGEVERPRAGMVIP